MVWRALYASLGPMVDSNFFGLIVTLCNIWVVHCFRDFCTPGFYGGPEFFQSDRYSLQHLGCTLFS